MQNNCRKICVYQKKAVLLHAFSVEESFNLLGRNASETIFRPKSVAQNEGVIE